MKIIRLFLLAGLAAPSILLPASDVAVKRTDDRIRVELGGRLFTEYIFKDELRPFFYPVLAADGTEMMRNYPMKGKNGVPGEEEDHSNHRSLWFTHGDVNGFDMWNTGRGPKQGRIVNESVKASTKNNVAIIESRNRWVGPDGAVQVTDDTVVRMRAIPEGRLLDYEVTLKAPAGKPVVFGDTKEGSMAIRLPHWMTPPHTFAGGSGGEKTKGAGHIVNDAGARDSAAWGKRSTWVDYYAPKDVKIYGVAIFDHPKNPRHPTWWHVRDYGLFAANPFGQHDFEKLKGKPGDFTIPAGGSATFRWRFYFHMGDEKTAKVAEQFKAYAAEK